MAKPPAHARRWGTGRSILQRVTDASGRARRAHPRRKHADRNLLERVAVAAMVLAGVLHLAVGYTTATVIGLVAVPASTIVILIGLWVGASALVVVTARTKPLATPLVPVGNALLLWAGVTAGSALFGWGG